MSSAPTPTPSVDWSSFWPDMIVALFTGLVIGVVFLVAERMLDSKRRSREARRSQYSAVQDCERWIAPDLRYSNDSLLPLDADLTRLERRMKEAGDGQPESVFPEFEYVRQLLGHWDLMKIAAEKIEARIEWAITGPGHWAAEGQQEFRRYLHKSFEEKPQPWADYWRSTRTPDLARDTALVADVKNYIVQRTLFEGLRRAFLASRAAYEQEYNKLVRERIDAAWNERGRKRYRPRPVPKKAMRQVVRDATLAGQRVIRTLYAKSDHRVEYMFARSRHHAAPETTPQ